MGLYMPTADDRALQTPLQVDTLDVVCIAPDRAPEHRYEDAFDGVVVDRFIDWMRAGRPEGEVWFFDSEPNEDRMVENLAIMWAHCVPCANLRMETELV